MFFRSFVFVLSCMQTRSTAAGRASTVKLRTAVAHFLRMLGSAFPCLSCKNTWHVHELLYAQLVTVPTDLATRGNAGAAASHRRNPSTVSTRALASLVAFCVHQDRGTEHQGPLLTFLDGYGLEMEYETCTAFVEANPSTGTQRS